MMTVEEILKALEVHTGKFPRQALQEAMNNPGGMVPELLRILRESRENIQQLLERPESMGHIYAMYLLAQFRESEAYPLLIDFFSTPGNTSVEVTGDVVTEDLCRILASVAGDQIDPLKALVANREADGFVRGAAMRSLVLMVAIERLSRAEVMEYFLSLFQGGLEREPSHAWDVLVSCCCKLHPEEAMGEIQKAYEEELVSPLFLSLEDVEIRLESSKETTLASLRRDKRQTLIENTIQEMQWWACFEDRVKSPPVKASASRDRPVNQAKSQKVGRNAPCPCGSGKKYKKCCGK